MNNKLHIVHSIYKGSTAATTGPFFSRFACIFFNLSVKMTFLHVNDILFFLLYNDPFQSSWVAAGMACFHSYLAAPDNNIAVLLSKKTSTFRFVSMFLVNES